MEPWPDPAEGAQPRWDVIPHPIGLVQLREWDMRSLMCLSPVSQERAELGNEPWEEARGVTVAKSGAYGWFSLGSASHSAAGVWAGQENVPRIGLGTSANTVPVRTGTFRFLKPSSHGSLSNVNIQNVAFAISSRIGDKMPLLSEVKISCIQRSLFHVLHSKSNLFCGLRMAETLMILLLPHVRYFLCRKRFSLNYF